MAGLIAEKDSEQAAYRKSCEDAGAERVRLEQAEMQRRIDERAAADAFAAEELSVIDEMTGEKVTSRELIDRNHARAMKAIADRAAAPLTAKDLQDGANLHELRAEQRSRFDAARAESLRPDLPAEKF